MERLLIFLLVCLLRHSPPSPHDLVPTGGKDLHDKESRLFYFCVNLTLVQKQHTVNTL